MKIQHNLLLCGALLVLGGCAGTENSRASDEMLARKAAISLNVPDNEVTVSSRSAEQGMGVVTLHFTATTKQGSTHRCYITSSYFGLLKSEAVCAGAATCNALLKAAGKC
ncbi:hypothetical protein AXE65_11145 [Ventosimonas gracilis]|uniref:Lipoprotein n=1 Tax=Ventosimonas gracilis TaxID=1680762 RepID=A0A139SWL3_9GAMM|nr:hypothetical protein [Ventosimonas gracilis]KXU38989.1 hypothetical protein AXE65_11145 [Ventosimonas gracilis]